MGTRVQVHGNRDMGTARGTLGQDKGHRDGDNYGGQSRGRGRGPSHLILRSLDLLLQLLGDHLPPEGAAGGGSGDWDTEGTQRGHGADREGTEHPPLVGGHRAHVVGADAQERGTFLDGEVALEGGG